MSELRFRVYGEPKGQPRPRAFVRTMGGRPVARVYEAGTAEAFKSQVAAAAREHLPSEPLAGPLSVVLLFTMPRPKGHYGTGRNAGTLKANAPTWHTGRPDVDNLAKAVMDALTSLRMWREDSCVCDLSVKKFYGSKPGVEVTIEPLTETTR